MRPNKLWKHLFKYLRLCLKIKKLLNQRNGVAFFGSVNELATKTVTKHFVIICDWHHTILWLDFEIICIKSIKEYNCLVAWLLRVLEPNSNVMNENGISFCEWVCCRFAPNVYSVFISHHTIFVAPNNGRNVWNVADCLTTHWVSFNLPWVASSFLVMHMSSLSRSLSFSLFVSPTLFFFFSICLHVFIASEHHYDTYIVHKNTSEKI